VSRFKRVEKIIKRWQARYRRKGYGRVIGARKRVKAGAAR
jgi:hypothetical protein